MIKLAGIFEDKLIMDRFISSLDFGLIDHNDVFVYDSREKAIKSFENNACDIVFTDNSFNQMSQMDFFSKVLKICSDTRIFVIDNEFTVTQIRSLFKMGADDCLRIDDLNFEYIEELLINSSNNSFDDPDKSHLREDKLRRFFWGETKLYDRIKQNYNITPDLVYIGAIRILIGDRSIVNAMKKCLTEHFDINGKGEFFFNNFSQIAVFFSPDDEVDLDYVTSELNKIIDLFFKRFKLKSFAVVEEKPLPMIEYHFKWAEFYRYTDYYFVSDKPVLNTSVINEEYTDSFDGNELLYVFKDILEKLDLKRFIAEADKLNNIKPTYNKLKALTDFVKALHKEVYNLDRSYQVGCVKYREFNTLLAAENIRCVTKYLIKCVNAISENISDLNRMSIHIKRYLEKNIDKNVTLSDIADNFNFEYNYSSKYFCKVMGMPFKKYLNDLRLETALNLIKNTTHKCYEISSMCGYKNYEHFSRVFYSKYGKWPREVKRNISYK